MYFQIVCFKSTYKYTKIRTTSCRVHFIFSLLPYVQFIKQYIYPLPFPYFSYFSISIYLIFSISCSGLAEKGEKRTFQDLRNSLAMLKACSTTEMCLRLIKSYQECVPQTKFLISQIFSVSLQFWACLHCGSVWRVQSKECYFKVYFLGMFLLIFIKNFVFIISFFDEVSNQKPKLGPPHVLSH